MAVTGKSDPRSDLELVESCNNGESVEATAAFEALYRRHRNFVLRVARRYVRDNDAALDVLQETFAYLLRKFPPAGEGLALRSKLTTLLYPVAKNSAISHVRKSERFANPEGTDPDRLPGPDNHSDSGIDRLVGRLPLERREIVLMRFVDDMSLQDIATALEIPLGTVKSRLHLAIRDLRGDPETKKFFAP